MNFMMNKNFEKSQTTTMHISSSMIGGKPIIKYIFLKNPLLFNLYENRLIHSEFLKEVFAELLENKEILKYNFKNKIFSLYNPNANFYILKIGFLQRSKIILLTILVVLLLRSFPYQLFINENTNFFRLYGKMGLKAFRSPFSLTLLVVNKLIRKLKIYTYSFNKRIKLIILNLYETLFLGSLQYRNFSLNLSLSSQNYIMLFKSLEFLHFWTLYNKFILFWICLLFKEQILINRVYDRLGSHLPLKLNEN